MDVDCDLKMEAGKDSLKGYVIRHVRCASGSQSPGNSGDRAAANIQGRERHLLRPVRRSPKDAHVERRGKALAPGARPVVWRAARAQAEQPHARGLEPVRGRLPSASADGTL